MRSLTTLLAALGWWEAAEAELTGGGGGETGGDYSGEALTALPQRLQACVDDAAAASAAAQHCNGPFVCPIPAGTHAAVATLTLPGFPIGCPLHLVGTADSAGNLPTLSGFSAVANTTAWAPRCVDPASSTARPCAASPVLGARVRVPRRFPQLLQLMEQRADTGRPLRQLHNSRWPNVPPATERNPFPLLNYTGAWRNVSNNSVAGSIVSDELKGTAVNWTGGVVMAVFKTQYTFTRPITGFHAASGTTEYPAPQGPGEGAGELWGRFWLSGKLGALDSPGEFHFEADQSSPSSSAGDDTLEGMLYVYPLPDSPAGPPQLLAKGVSFAAESAVAPRYVPGKPWHRHLPVANVHLEGLNFAGATVSLSPCENCSITNCRFNYPSFQPDIPEVYGVANYTRVSGDNSIVRNVSHSNTPHPIHFSGTNVTVDNVLIENQGWYGTLQYQAMSLRTVDSTVSNVEIRYTGNVGLEHNLWLYDAEHVYKTNASRMTVTGAYIHHGCILAEDCALLYTGNIYLNGSTWGKSILHDSGQMCLRFDDHARNGTVDSVLLFNCGTGDVPWTPVPWSPATGHADGGLFKGDFHRLRRITAYNAPMNSLALGSVCSASVRCNNNTVVENCAAEHIGTCFNRGTAQWASVGNVEGKPASTWRLRNAPSSSTAPIDWDPRPEEGSVLCGAGANGADVGAFACSDSPRLNWRPGCTLVGCTRWRDEHATYEPPITRLVTDDESVALSAPLLSSVFVSLYGPCLNFSWADWYCPGCKSLETM